MQEGDPFYRFFFSPPPVPLSGDKDPSVDRQQNQDKLRGKVEPSGMMLVIVEMRLRFAHRSVARTFLTNALTRQLLSETVY